MQERIRRVVTGHDPTGKAVVVSDGPAPSVHSDPRRPGNCLTQIWITDETPVPIGTEADPTLRRPTLTPPRHGSAFKILDLAPDGDIVKNMDPNAIARAFEAMGAPSASTYRPGAPHPLIHRTETLDYAIILSGEIYLVLDDSEVLLREGDMVVQCGTNHAWSNRSDRPCRIAFFMIDGRFDENLKSRFDTRRHPA